MFKIFFIILIFSPLAFSDETEFNSWKKNYIQRAAKVGIPSTFSKKILADVKLNEKVLERYKNQVVLDKDRDYNDFVKKWLRDDKKRIKEAQALMEEHKDLLLKVEKKYGVDKEVIIALWGVETFFGKIMGDYDVVTALATLSYEGRRRTFYEKQLHATLRLIYKNKVSRESLVGSWAGATGQCQFMPSNIFAYGVDFDQDGKIDLWKSKPDIFASMANLLKNAGWQKGKAIGSLVHRNKPFNGELEVYRSPSTYSKLGFKSLNNRSLKNANWKARKASKIPMKNSPLILRGSNYKPLMRWNRSSLFAALNILITDSLVNN